MWPANWHTFFPEQLQVTPLECLVSVTYYSNLSFQGFPTWGSVETDAQMSQFPVEPGLQIALDGLDIETHEFVFGRGGVSGWKCSKTRLKLFESFEHLISIKLTQTLASERLEEEGL